MILPSLISPLPIYMAVESTGNEGRGGGGHDFTIPYQPIAYLHGCREYRQ